MVAAARLREARQMTEAGPTEIAQDEFARLWVPGLIGRIMTTCGLDEVMARRIAARMVMTWPLDRD